MRFPDPTRLTVIVNAHRGLFLAAAVALWLATWTVVGGSIWYVHAAVRGLPDQATVRGAGEMVQATTVMDVKGRHAFTIFAERRLPVPLGQVSPHLIKAILAIEDRRFYDHGGVDPIRVAGAALHDVMNLRAEQGGSTITQQLARLSLLTPEKTFRRKLQEVVLARRLEGVFSKDEILELYLNKAYFGDGLYGVEAAARGYFGKPARDLNVAEAALIAGLVKSPSTYAPTANAARAKARRNVVLKAMRDVRAIDEHTYQGALASPVRLNDTLRREEAYGQYFKEEVRKQLVEMFGWDRVHHDGLKVETTLDLDMQKAADAEVARSLENIERLQLRRRRGAAASGADTLEAALVAIDPRSGEVRAMVGGRDFDRSRFNRATQARRQPGSAFKPFVYAAALEQGYTPSTLITGLSEPIMTSQGAWLPEDDHLESDVITMRAALRTSSNRAAVRMLQTIGIHSAVQYAKQLGIGTMPPVLSLALGSGEVTLLSMTSAFGAFANAGQLAAPSLIRRVTTSDGQPLYEAKVNPKTAISPTTAFLITSMLQDVVNAGTAAGARQLGFRLPAAGKTGTTNDYRDAWFVGYTPNLVTGVWIGYDQPRTIVRGGYAAELAVPLWARFMTTVTRDEKPASFRVPPAVSVVALCRVSGRVATDACRRSGDGMIYSDYVTRGSEPVEPCPVHGVDPFRASLPEAAPVLATVPPPAAPPVAATIPAQPEPAAVIVESEPEKKKKKRGFWARVFGVGGDGRKEKDKEKEKDRKQ